MKKIRKLKSPILVLSISPSVINVLTDHRVNIKHAELLAPGVNPSAIALEVIREGKENGLLGTNWTLQLITEDTIDIYQEYNLRLVVEASKETYECTFKL